MQHPIIPSRGQHGMTTAEYSVGTLGAVVIAGVLVKLGVDGWFFDEMKEIVAHALDPGRMLDLVRGGPFGGIRP